MNWNLMFPCSVLAVVTLVAGSGGCGGGRLDSLPRKPITGTVTLDGTPLDSASLTLTPVDPGENPTPVSTLVSAGAFSVAEESGPVAGKYRVSLSVRKPVSKKGASKSAAVDANDEFDATPTRESLPARYNSQTELTAEVTESGPNKFVFTLTSK